MITDTGFAENKGMSLVVIYALVLSALAVVAPPDESGGYGRYIVQLDADFRAEQVEQAAGAAERETGGSRGHTYHRAIRGFSITLPPQVSMERLYRIPGVTCVEPDIQLFLTAQPPPRGVTRINAHRSPIANINGIDQRVDVGVAVIDTGIQPDHPDLNVVGGRRFYTVTVGPPARPRQEVRSDDQYQDTDGHGTHVAGIIGALDNSYGVVGVAPGARLWALKVFQDGEENAYLSDIIGALDWVAEHYDQIEIVNMSLGGKGFSSAYRTTIQGVVAEGVIVIAAAGNSGEDIYGDDGVFGSNDNFIPAAFPEVMTVSALQDTDGEPGGEGGPNDDRFWTGSNYSASVVSGNPVNSPGAAIDLMMPGVSIYSTHINSGYTTKSGTSMAAPHAAGLVALYIAANGRANNAAEVYAIRQALIDAASPQTSPRGLAVQNDPDNFPEPIGYIIPADVNYDGCVDAQDLLMMAQAWLTGEQDAGFCLLCDMYLPPDGVVDLNDFTEFASYWLIGCD